VTVLEGRGADFRVNGIGSGGRFLVTVLEGRGDNSRVNVLGSGS